MARAIQWVRDLNGGDSPTICTATAGGAFVPGDPLYWSSGKLVKQPGGTDTNVIEGIAYSTATADGDACSYIPVLPGYVFKMAKSGSPTLGTKYGITTGFALDATNVTQVRFKYHMAADDGDVYVRSLDWLA